MPSDQESCSRWSQFARYRARRDTACERIVEASFDLQRYCGTAYAASYLEVNGVDLETALRVLTEPGKRRQLIFA